MSILDWPTDRAFAPVQPGGYVLTPRSPKSAFSGFYTGNRQTLGHAADRMQATLTLPACDPQDAARREAFIGSLVSTGDQVRLPHFMRRVPSGSLRGNPTVGANVAAGARIITLAGALAAPNLLLGSGFEMDSNADGLSDGWLSYSIGSASGLVYSRPAGLGSPSAQRLDVAALGSGAGDGAGLFTSGLASIPGSGSYVLSLDCLGSAGLVAVLYVDWFNAGNVFVGQSNPAQAMPVVATRLQFAINAPATAASARTYFWIKQASGTASASVILDNVQLELGSVASAYAGFATLVAGDVLGAGGDLLLTGYAGATLNDMGAGTVPQSFPLKRALTAGAVVTAVAPTGLFELLAREVSFEHGWGNWQGRLNLPFLEA